MSERDLWGLLTGIGLLAAMATCVAYVFFHSRRFGWLVLSPTASESPPVTANPDRSRAST